MNTKEKMINNMIVVDVETTGLNPYKNAILSIGAVDTSDLDNMFYAECTVWPGAEISDYALKINGFKANQILFKNEYSLEEAMTKFLGWAEEVPNHTIAGENPRFDLDFLNASAKRCKKKWNLGYRTIDLHTLCYSHHIRNGIIPPTIKNHSSMSLDQTLVYCGLPTEPNPHNALTGAKMEAEAIWRILYNKNLLKEFKDYNIPF